MIIPINYSLHTNLLYSVNVIYFNEFIQNINLIKTFIFLTFFHGIYSLKIKYQQHLLLLLVLFVGMLTELISTMLSCFNLNRELLYSVSFIIYHLLWLLIITSAAELENLRKIILSAFITFGIINLFFIEKTGLNHLTFIVGALIYISLFLYFSYHQLNRENLSYFTKNEYLLLFIPIIFFFGYSFMFGFRNSDIRYVIIYKNIDLYIFVGYFGNIVYYSLANLYIYKERKILISHEN